MSTTPTSGRTFRKVLLIAAGSVSLALGAVGVLLPLLPTTPFLLLAAFCYLSSSRRLYDWLINHRVFGAYIYNYVTFRAVKRSVKIGVLVVLWLTLTVSILLVHNLYIRIALVVIGAAVSIHVLTLRTLNARSTGSARIEKNNNEQAYSVSHASSDGVRQVGVGDGRVQVKTFR